MDSKPLLYGLTGFFMGGLLVSVAATTFEKDRIAGAGGEAHTVSSLEGKRGDAYDKAFLQEMIVHHQSAVDMAKLAQDNAKHDEVKKLADDIMRTQSQEIDMMQTWQAGWGYKTVPKSHENGGDRSH